MKKKSIIKNSIIIFLVTGLILYLVFGKDYHEIISLLSSVKLEYIFIALLVYFVYFLLDQLAFYLIIRNYNKKATYRFTLYIGIISKFFNGITPLATGGQPMQVYELHKKNMSVVNSTNAVVLNLIAFKCAYIFLIVVLFIIDRCLNIFTNIPVLKVLTIIGFIVNISFLLLLFVLSFSKNTNKKIVNFVIKIITKIFRKINVEKVSKKINDFCDEYYQSAKSIVKNKALFIKCISIQVISLLFYFSIPYALAFSLDINNLSLLSTIIAGEYIYIMGNSIPLPGSSGGMEYGFYGFFCKLISGSGLSALMMLWRVLTYYIPMTIGAIIFGAYNINPSKKQELSKK